MRRSRLYVIVMATLLALGGAASAQPSARTAELDRKAKRLFVAGNYKEAIEILAELYTDTGNAIYLRNIARCHQRLRDPDRAIASFEEYLLRGKDISPQEREEVKGFIRELEQMKRGMTGTGEATTRAGPPPPAAPPPQPAPAPAAAPPSAAAPAGPSPPPAAPAGAPLAAGPPIAPVPPPGMSAPTALTPPSPEVPEVPSVGQTDAAAPPEGRWKKTAGIAGLATAGALAAAGGVVVGTSWSSYNKARDEGCGTSVTCDSRAKTVESRNKLALILFAGAAVTGATGLTFLLLSPATPSGEGTARAGLTVSWRGGF